MILRLIFLLIFVIALWFSVGANLARAGGEAQSASQTYAPWTGPYADELPYPTDDIWLTMGWNRKQTSSACIGQVKNVLCAVETYLACRLRDDPALCEKARGEWNHSADPYNFVPRSGLMRYQVTGISRFTEISVSEVLKEEPLAPLKSGDILVNIYWEMCGRSDRAGRVSECCFAPGGVSWSESESSFLLRRLPDRWVIVESFHPGGMSYWRWNSRPEDWRAIKLHAKKTEVNCDEIKAPIFRRVH